MNRAGHQRTVARRDEPLRHTERHLVQGAALSPSVTTWLRSLEPAVARLERSRIRITDRHERSGSGNAAQLDTANGVDVRLLRDPRTSGVSIALRDRRLSDSLTVEVDRANVLAAFYHPDTYPSPRMTAHPNVQTESRTP